MVPQGKTTEEWLHSYALLFYKTAMHVSGFLTSVILLPIQVKA